MAKRLRVAACIAALNEEKTIARIVLSTSEHVNAVVVIDDGSDDYTGLIAEKLGAHVVRHERNEGKGACLIDSISWVKRRGYDVMVTLDADGQHDPDEIPKLLQPLRDDKADIVIGSRLRRPSSMPRIRRLGQRSLDNLVRVKSGETIVDSQSGYRAYTKSAIDRLKVTELGMGGETQILINAASLGLRIEQVPVSIYYGLGETSKLNPIVHFSDVFSAYLREVIGRRPLRFLGIPGLVLIAYAIYGWLEILSTYNFTAEFATGHALVYTIIMMSGMFMTMGALVLFVIRLMLQEIRGR